MNFGKTHHHRSRHIYRSVQRYTPLLSHLEFEALLTAARESANVFDFALVAMLGLLGRR